MLTYWPLAIAYLLGAIPSGLFIARMFGVKDIRRHGSGNIGATNVWRVIGARAAVWVYVADIGKGVLAVLIASLYPATGISYDLFLVLAAIVAILGNVFPVFLKFKGGKGVNTSLGTLLFLMPLNIGIGLVVFAIVVALSKYISLGSIMAAITLVVSVIVEREWLARPVDEIYLYLSIAIALVVLWSHRTNIKRLLNHTENRFSFSSRAGKAGSNA